VVWFLYAYNIKPWQLEKIGECKKAVDWIFGIGLDLKQRKSKPLKDQGKLLQDQGKLLQDYKYRPPEP
jgi:hypothetical protein